MYKTTIGSFLVMISGCSAAWATCSSYPNTLTNGTTADASQVMANFNCAALTQGATIDTITLTGITAASGPLNITRSVNSAAAITELNSNGGSSAASALFLQNGVSHTGIFYMFGSAWTTSGMRRADGAYLAGDGAGGLTVSTEVSQPVYFGVNATEVGRFGTDGSFLINSTTNGGWSTVAKFEATAPTGKWGVSGYNTGSSGGSFLARVDNSATHFLDMYVSTSSVGSISTNGTATAYNTTSDTRLKTNVQPLTPLLSLEALNAYDPQTYSLRGKFGVGALAQAVDDRMHKAGIDAEEIGLVSRGDNDRNRTENQPGFQQWQMDSSKMMPFAIRVILDQQKRIEALEQRGLVLERRVKSFESQHQADSRFEVDKAMQRAAQK